MSVELTPPAECSPPREDLTGKRLGKWQLLRFAGRDKYGRSCWHCRCNCGTEKVVEQARLKAGRSTKCRSCATSEAMLTHGEADTRLYAVWRSMIQRCEHPKNPCYDDYGGRGIRFCDEWRTFEVFRLWALFNGYKTGLTIERVNVDGGYDPSNCSWATNKEQQRNKRNNRLVEFQGRKVCVAEAAELSGLAYTTICNRLKRGWSDFEALHTPPGEPRAAVVAVALVYVVGGVMS